MRKSIKGSVTIEATVIIPIAFFVVGLVFSMLLYYHDKNILVAASYETATFGSHEDNLQEGEIEEYFFSCIQGRLLLFSNVNETILVRNDSVDVTCTAREGIMTLKTNCKMKKTNPEQYIRSIRNMKHIGE